MNVTDRFQTDGTEMQNSLGKNNNEPQNQRLLEINAKLSSLAVLRIISFMSPGMPLVTYNETQTSEGISPTHEGRKEIAAKHLFLSEKYSKSTLFLW